MLRKGVFIVLCIIACVDCDSVLYEDCGSTYEIENIDIEGCERAIPCYLTVGVKTNITINYVAEYVSTSLNQEAFVTLNSIQREISVSPSACQATWCPVKVQTVATYEAKLELPTNLALNTRGFLRWHIINENKIRVMCFQVTVQTQSLLHKLNLISR